MFFWLSVTGGLGVLILMAATSVAVIGFFARHPGGESRWRRVIAPSIAAVALGAVLVASVVGFGDLLDLPATSPLRWAFPTAYAAAAAAGIGWALVLRATRPRAYAAIGLGPDRPHPIPNLTGALR